MKTINELAKDYAIENSLIGHEKPPYRGFIAGFEEAQRWFPILEELPAGTETGLWDGVKSDFVIARRANGDWFKAKTYSGIMNGCEFCDWFDERDFELTGIVEWKPIERK